MTRPTRWAMWFTGFLVLAPLGLGLSGIRLNFTESAPRGLYCRSKSQDARYVLFCPDAEISRVSKPYRISGICADGGAPLLKPVGAAGGDVVSVTPQGLVVNGVLLSNTAARPTDSHGRPLAHYPYGTYNVQPGELWVISTYNADSFDSRYFGPIKATRATARMEPLWTE